MIVVDWYPVLWKSISYVLRSSLWSSVWLSNRGKHRRMKVTTLMHWRSSRAAFSWRRMQLLNVIRYDVITMIRSYQVISHSVPQDLWNWHLARYKSDYYYYYLLGLIVQKQCGRDTSDRCQKQKQTKNTMLVAHQLNSLVCRNMEMLY